MNINTYSNGLIDDIYSGLFAFVNEHILTKLLNTFTDDDDNDDDYIDYNNSNDDDDVDTESPLQSNQYYADCLCRSSLHVHRSDEGKDIR